MADLMHVDEETRLLRELRQAIERDRGAREDPWSRLRRLHGELLATDFEDDEFAAPPPLRFIQGGLSEISDAEDDTEDDVA